MSKKMFKQVNTFIICVLNSERIDEYFDFIMINFLLFVQKDTFYSRRKTIGKCSYHIIDFNGNFLQQIRYNWFLCGQH